MLQLKHWLVPKFTVAITANAITQLVLLINYHSAQASPPKWHQASDVAPRGLMQQVVKENFSQPTSKVNFQAMGVMKIPGQEQPLYIIDPRSNSLCGAAGCAYFGYVPHSNGYRRVLSIYLNPNLPPQTPLITTASKTAFGLPCLNFSQLNQNQVEVVQWCYNGKEYNFVSSNFTPKSLTKTLVDQVIPAIRSGASAP